MFLNSFIQLLNTFYIYYPWLATVTSSCFSNFKGGAWLVQPLAKTKETLAEAHGSATRDAHFFIYKYFHLNRAIFFSHLKKVYMLCSLNYNPRLFNHNYISYEKGMARLLYLFGMEEETKPLIIYKSTLAMLNSLQNLKSNSILISFPSSTSISKNVAV